jgi:hypothetical protein
MHDPNRERVKTTRVRGFRDGVSGLHRELPLSDLRHRAADADRSTSPRAEQHYAAISRESIHPVHKLLV